MNSLDNVPPVLHTHTHTHTHIQYTHYRPLHPSHIHTYLLSVREAEYVQSSERGEAHDSSISHQRVVQTQLM